MNAMTIRTKELGYLGCVFQLVITTMSRNMNLEQFNDIKVSICSNSERKTHHVYNVIDIERNPTTLPISQIPVFPSTVLSFLA